MGLFMLKHRVFLSFAMTAWIATSSFASPQLLTNTSIKNEQADAAALDRHMGQMWDNQQKLVASMVQQGALNAADQVTDRHHDHGDGMGGDFGDDMSVLSDAKDDHIQQQIDQISHQAEVRQEKLDRLSASLSMSQSYHKATGKASSLNIGPNMLAIEPVANARVTSDYGYRTMGGRGEYHPGVDLAAPIGTPIYSTGNGVVVKAGWVRGYGQLVEIDHGNGLITRYGHASRLYVSVGETVQANQQIAAVGCTGRCTGPHLHYEVLKNGQRENPATYLALAPKRDS